MAEMWKDIAQKEGITFEWKELPLKDILQRVENGRLDAGVAAITITEERERASDFTHPVYSDGLAIGVRAESETGIWALLKRFYRLSLLRLFLHCSCCYLFGFSFGYLREKITRMILWDCFARHGKWPVVVCSDNDDCWLWRRFKIILRPMFGNDLDVCIDYRNIRFYGEYRIIIDGE